MAVIKSIVECDFTNNDDNPRSTQINNFSGFVITLDDGSIIDLGIDNIQSCCENWGYLMSEDNFSEFIGSSVLDIQEVDNQFNITSHRDHDNSLKDVNEDEVIFVNIQTTVGTLQFVAYNAHNGNYGHNVAVRSNLFNLEQRL